MSAPAAETCGPYELVAQREGSLRQGPDGSLELDAEARYLVRLGDGADPGALPGALTVPAGGREGTLQFGNFVGTTELGGRRIEVRSDRISAPAVHRMLDDVARWLASLPFAAGSPTAAPYERGRSIGPDPLYHAYAFLRDGMEGRGGHHVAAAVERILARPHESLRTEPPVHVPLGRASVVDSTTVDLILNEPELLVPVGGDSPLAGHPLARRLGGHMPELVRSRPLAHTTDNRENRFVVAALETMADIARRFERLAATGKRAAHLVNTREAAGLAGRCERWRRHPAIEALPPARGVSPHSTVLRGRAGYRELLRFHGELLARTRLAEPHDLRSLLELRDAADIYEIWCFFRVVAAVAKAIEAPLALERFAVAPFGTRVPWGYRAHGRGVEVAYNVSYSRPAGDPAEKGRASYSVQLRPDIGLRGTDGRLHLLDAKLKVDFRRAVAAEDADDPTGPPGTFKREDLYKMHAYRDALGADSVWVLYPGGRKDADVYQVPWGTTAGGFEGVGAIALRPGAGHDGGLQQRVAAILGGSA